MWQREALIWLKNHSFTNVVMESDSIFVVQSICSTLFDCSCFRMLVDDGKALMRNVSISFIK